MTVTTDLAAVIASGARPDFTGVAVGAQTDAEQALYQGIASREAQGLAAQNIRLREHIDAERAITAQLRGELHELRTRTPEAQEMADLRAVVTMVADAERGGKIQLGAVSIGFLRRAASRIEQRRVAMVLAAEKEAKAMQ